MWEFILLCKNINVLVHKYEYDLRLIILKLFSLSLSLYIYISSNQYANLRWYSLYHFFDLMDDLPIHVPYKAKVGGSIQYGLMYPFERLDITHVV